MSERSARRRRGGLGLVALATLALVLTGCSAPGSTPSPTSPAPQTAAPATPTPTATSTGTATAFADLTIGMCLTNSAGSLQQQTGTVNVVPCSAPHSSEVYSLPALSGDAFPGDESVAAMASDACTNDFAGYVGQDVSTSDLDFGVYVPDQDQWTAGQRRAVCVVFYPQGDVVGSMRGIGGTPPQLAP